jgi:hypothetical protein
MRRSNPPPRPVSMTLGLFGSKMVIGVLHHEF